MARTYATADTVGLDQLLEFVRPRHHMVLTIPTRQSQEAIAVSDHSELSQIADLETFGTYLVARIQQTLTTGALPS